MWRQPHGRLNQLVFGGGSGVPSTLCRLKRSQCTPPENVLSKMAIVNGCWMLDVPHNISNLTD